MGRYQIVDEFAVQLGYTHLFYFSRDTAGTAENATLAETSRSPDNGGLYKQTIGVINLGVQATFDPFTDAPAPAAVEPAETAQR